MESQLRDKQLLDYSRRRPTRRLAGMDEQFQGLLKLDEIKTQHYVQKKRLYSVRN
jgi:hypothetical protein